MLKCLSAVCVALIVLALPLPARAAPFDGRRGQFADSAFQAVWSRTDAERVRGGRFCNQQRPTNSPSDDEAASWSADGGRLAFASNRDGDFEIFAMSVIGGDLLQLTNNSAQDRWAVWAQ
jgi:hypothetical protein